MRRGAQWKWGNQDDMGPGTITSTKDTPGLRFRADFQKAVYFRGGIMCTLRKTKDLIDGGQARAKPHLRKAKPNLFFIFIFLFTRFNYTVTKYN